MTDRFTLCVPFTISSEGGYSLDRRDSGNWWNGNLVGSNYGVTPADIATMEGSKFVISAAFIRDMTRDYAETVMRVAYWQALRCDDLPPGVDLFAFDYGFNAGKRTSGRDIQMAAGLEGDDVDGWIGAQTVAAVAAVNDHAAMVDRLAAYEAAHYRSLAQYPIFGAGWINRVNARLALAKKMIASPTISA